MKKLLIFVLLCGSHLPIFPQNFNWAKSFGGSSDDFANAIAVDLQGNVYTAGSYSGIIDFDPGPATYTLPAGPPYGTGFIQKLDVSGNFVWAKQIPLGYIPLSIVHHTSGNLHIQGVNFISKIDPLGNVIWTRDFNITATGFNAAWWGAQAIDSVGNVYSTGYFHGTIDFNPGVGNYTMTATGSYSAPGIGKEDIFVLKLNNNGDFLWAKRMGDTIGDRGHAIALDARGHVYVTGHFAGTVDFDPGVSSYTLSSGSNTTNSIFFISKLDSSGNFLWAKNLQGTGYSDGLNISVTSPGEIYTTGIFGGLVDFDPGLSVYPLVETDAGYVLKLDTIGNLLWAKSLQLNHWDIGTVIQDVAGNVFVSGGFKGTVDFDPGVATFSVVSTGNSDIFILKLTTSGNFVFVKTIGGTDTDWGTTALDTAGNIYSAGFYKSTCDVDPGPGSYQLTSTGSYDCYVLKLGNAPLTATYTTTHIELLAAENGLYVYPNPSSGKITVVSTKPFGANCHYMLTDIMGKELLKGHISDQFPEIDIYSMLKGVYLLTVEGMKKPIKIIKQ